MSGAAPSRRERRAWLLLVGIQLAMVAAVLVAILVVWVIGQTGDFAPR